MNLSTNSKCKLAIALSLLILLLHSGICSSLIFIISTTLKLLENRKKKVAFGNASSAGQCGVNDIQHWTVPVSLVVMLCNTIDTVTNYGFSDMTMTCYGKITSLLMCHQ